MEKKRQEENGSQRYFHGCGICGAMRKADNAGRGLSLEELRSAFREQNKRQNESD